MLASPAAEPPLQRPGSGHIAPEGANASCQVHPRVTHAGLGRAYNATGWLRPRALAVMLDRYLSRAATGQPVHTWLLE